MAVGEYVAVIHLEFESKLPERKFDNFAFVNFPLILQIYRDKAPVAFALHALEELPGVLPWQNI